MRDHPRACGEKGAFGDYEYSISGSPPRVRGKEFFVCDALISVGITPARAGKRNAASRAAESVGDHPRACGEKVRKGFFHYERKGSPLRVRGKVDPSEMGDGWSGITPARAGKSGRAFPCDPADGDHPRACGEKSPHRKSLRVRAGSPPRVRGKDTSIAV